MSQNKGSWIPVVFWCSLIALLSALLGSWIGAAQQEERDKAAQYQLELRQQFQRDIDKAKEESLQPDASPLMMVQPPSGLKGEETKLVFFGKIVPYKVFSTSNYRVRANRRNVELWVYRETHWAKVAEKESFSLPNLESR